MQLNELTFDNLGVWPLPAKILILAFTSLIIVGLGYWFTLRPQFNQLSQSEAQEIELRSTFEIKSSQASNLRVYKQQIVDVQKMLNNMLYQLPEKTEIPNLIEDISKVGVASGLEFNLIKPMEEKKKDFYVEIPIEISVAGNYHQLAQFISSLANLQRIVTVSDFTIERKSQQQTVGTTPNTDQQAVLNPELEMKMVAETYHYLTEAEIASDTSEKTANPTEQSGAPSATTP